MINFDQYKLTIEEWKHCPMANYVCPVHRATYLESLSPRGFALLMAYMDKLSEEDQDSAVERLFQCSMCRLCQAKSKDETSIPDAIAYFRWLCHRQKKFPGFLSQYLQSVEKATESIKDFVLPDENGRNNQPLFLIDPFTRESNANLFQKISQRFNLKEIVLPASLVFLYNWGIWNLLWELGGKLKSLENFTGDIIVETSMDKFILKKLRISANIKTFASYLSSNRIRFQNLNGARTVVIPDFPEDNVSLPKSDLYRLLSSSGMNYYTTYLRETIPITPKEFPSYRDILHAKLFPSTAEKITSDVFLYSSLYGVQLLITESLETAFILKKFQDPGGGLEIVDLFTFAISNTISSNDEF